MASDHLHSGNVMFLPSASNSISPLSGKSGEISEALELRFAGGSYRFGESISPNEIAAQFGVSQQPVRAALAQLRALGYLIVTPQIGCRVASPSSSEISDFFLFLGGIEGVMAALAASRHNAAEIGELDAVGEELTACIVGGEMRQPAETYIHLVGEWHRIIRGMARSDALAWRLRSFWRMSDFLLWQGAPDLIPERLALANRQRASIRDALATRDPHTVEHLMAAHVRGKPHRVGILPTLSGGSAFLTGDKSGGQANALADGE